MLVFYDDKITSKYLSSEVRVFLSKYSSDAFGRGFARCTVSRTGVGHGGL